MQSGRQPLSTPVSHALSPHAAVWDGCWTGLLVLADSKFVVISGQHVGKAVAMMAEDLRRMHAEVPDSLKYVKATVLAGTWDLVNGGRWETLFCFSQLREQFRGSF